MSESTVIRVPYSKFGRLLFALSALRDDRNCAMSRSNLFEISVFTRYERAPKTSALAPSAAVIVVIASIMSSNVLQRRRLCNC